VANADGGVAGDALQRAPGRISVVEPVQFEAPRILLVDDEEAVREELAMRLNEEGYACVAASSADAALVALTAETDLVLARLNLSGRDGRWLVEQVRQRQPDTWTLILSEEGERPRVVECLKAGAAGWIPRPPKSTDLVRAIERALAKRRIEFARRKYEARLGKLSR
jgi:DNA-binding NtrC family response regulator